MKDIKYVVTQIKLNMINEFQNRGAFLTQFFGMFFNDLALIYVWMLFFTTFGTVNGWGQLEMIGAQGFHMLSYGISQSIFYGAVKLPQLVWNGSFDNLLLTPKKIYLRVMTAGLLPSAFGDFILGIILLTIYSFVGHLGLVQIFFIIGLVIPTALLFANITLICSLTAFLMEDAVDTSRGLFELFITPGFYPANLYEGFLKILFIAVFPAIVVSGFPLDAVRESNFLFFILIWLIALFWTFIAYKLLNRAIKRYESGNLVNVR